MDSFAKIEKSRQMAVFGHFWVNLGCFSHPSHTILMPLRMQGPIGCRMTVQFFFENPMDSLTVFDKFEIFMKGREKKPPRLHK